MGLLNQAKDTLQVKQDRVAANIRRTMAGSLQQLKSMWSVSFAMMWHNPAGLTPQQVCDALGGDAAEFFSRSAAMATFINSQASGTSIEPIEESAPYKTKSNPDGTVTIGDAI